jgi:hypothetical protein
MARFDACGVEAGRFGVYDSVAGRWSTPLELDEPAAEHLAEVLNERYGDDDPGPELVSVRWPAVSVRAVTEWTPATVDVLIRERAHDYREEWYARVHDPAGSVRWYPARELRPTPDVEGLNCRSRCDWLVAHKTARSTRKTTSGAGSSRPSGWATPTL